MMAANHTKNIAEMSLEELFAIDPDANYVDEFEEISSFRGIDDSDIIQPLKRLLDKEE